MDKSSQKVRYEVGQLELEINQLRDEMIQFGLENGLNNPETIRYSQMLDDLIFTYQTLKMNAIPV